MGQNLRKARKLRLRNPQNQGCRRQRRRQSCKRPQKGPSSPQHNVTWEISNKDNVVANYSFTMRNVACLFIVLGASCTGPNQVSVKRDWSNAIRNYGLIPVYPLRENVYVGDLRVTGESDDPFTLGYRTFGRIDVSKALKAEIESFPELPKTVAEGSGTNIKFPQQTGKITEPRRNAERLHLAALPAVTVGRVSAADLAAIGPVGAASAALNLGFRSQDQVEISLQGIESLEISDVNVFGALNKLCDTGVLGEVNVLAALKASAAQVTDTKVSDENSDAFLSVITRVFYARQITYTSTSNRSFGAGANADIDGGAPSSVTPSAPKIDSDGNLQPIAATNLSGSIESAPGVAQTFVSASNSSIKLTQVFERPMAFGVDVLAVKIGQISKSTANCTFTRVPSGGSFSGGVRAMSNKPRTGYE